MNNLEKNERINNLLELYGNLLTDKQKEVMDMYYKYDLSISEISENCNISRAATFDMIKRVEKTLEDYESKLNLLNKREKITKIIEKLDEKTKEDILDIL